MKKTLSGLISATLLLACAAQAEDTSATIDISGVLKEADFSCSVGLSEGSVSILDRADTMIKQGENATFPVIIHATVDGGEKCEELVAQGKIAYWFEGTADNADGTVLANYLTDETAAKGVGIGIFDSENKPVAVNSGRIAAQTDTTFGLQMVQLTNQQPVAGNINSTVTVQIERL
ncbi:fimbrial protein [Siccibacter colletis]|uniref:fimbrial protein n=1 Tax=Siccibacter colletis TaxID=1505757 RepID=UPI0004E1C8E1|nr:fimbrial protein [Siccibacter colletis]